MQVLHVFDHNTEHGQYIIACARIRNMTVTHLVRELVDVIARDQLVLAVLDDDSKPERRRSEHKFRNPP